MIMKTTIAQEVILTDYRRLSMKFCGELFKEWDKAGQGYFGEWMKVGLRQSWEDYARCN